MGYRNIISNKYAEFHLSFFMNKKPCFPLVVHTCVGPQGAVNI